ncbi:MAG: anthranilate phosphoribosyltransferase [Pedobacter sp.]|nr:MAG: anthranilate phosphoribosyltransferase [Pedobacter sp.]
MKHILNHLFEHKSFDRAEAKAILKDIALGSYTNTQVAAFMTVYGMRAITVAELQGFRDAMLDLASPLKIYEDYELIDLCGTGGDGKNTFNISTLASFILAGAGYKVAKHGNYGVSSGCGSSNVMEYLGLKFKAEEALLNRSLDEAGICFLHAPLYHPAMKTVAPIRKELGVKTFFNMLGPMVNPVKPAYQMVGVFNLELARLYAYLYQHSGNKYTIVHALDGYDEVSLTGDFKTFSEQGEQLHPLSSLGFVALKAEAIQGGNTIPEAAQYFTAILRGQGTQAQNQVVLSNAALGIQTLNRGMNFHSAYAQAEESLFSKKAFQSFNTLIQLHAKN